MPFQLTDRERSWIDALLILATVAVGFIVAGFVTSVFFYFGDILLVFFLAWLLAFILSPIIAGDPAPGSATAAGRRRRSSCTRMLVGALAVLVLVVAQALASSISDFIAGVPRLQRDLPTILAPWQDRLRAIGLGQVDLAAQGAIFLSNLNDYAAQLVGPIQQLAVASLGALGNVLLMLILSLYMVVDSRRIMSFLLRLVPPATPRRPACSRRASPSRSAASSAARRCWA